MVIVKNIRRKIEERINIKNSFNKKLTPESPNFKDIIVYF